MAKKKIYVRYNCWKKINVSTSSVFINLNIENLVQKVLSGLKQLIIILKEHNKYQKLSKQEQKKKNLMYLIGKEK